MVATQFRGGGYYVYIHAYIDKYMHTQINTYVSRTLFVICINSAVVGS